MGGNQSVLSATITFIAATLVIALLGVGLGFIGLPVWPFVILLLVYATIDGFDRKKFLWDTLSGFIALFAVLANPVLTELTGNSMVGTAAFLIIAAVLGSAFVKGGVSWASLCGILLLSMPTLFGCTPQQLCGVADCSALEGALRVFAGYGIGFLLNLAVGAAAVKVLSGGADKADAKAEKAAE